MKEHDILYEAILSSMGITEDVEPDMADADFWAKHDKDRHGGHFDPETMTCKLREKYEQGEKIENLKDEMDDIEGESPDVGASGNAGSGNVTPEEDAAYLEAVKNSDIETANKMVNNAAMAAGYTTHAYHGTELEYFNNGQQFTIFDDASHSGTKEIAEKVAKSKSLETKGNAPYVYSVFLKLENPKRVSDVPTSWNDTHSEYWWDQMHKAAKEGYDGLVYSNNYEDRGGHDDSYVPFYPSQIKSADPVTYDDEGNVIPLSRRFDDGPDIRGDVKVRDGGDLNSDPDYGIISDVLKAEKDRQNGRPAQFHQRVPEEALRGGDEGTRILREASLICRATEGTGSQGEGNSGGGYGRGEGAAEGAVSGVEQAREASRRQEAILEKYAKKLGIWEDDAATALKERDDYDYIEGGETIAFFPDDTNKPLTKVITSAYFPETVQLLDRIILHNYLFPYSKLDVKGFGRARPDWLTDGEPMFCVKVEQQPVDTSCPAKPEQIEEYMKNLGFHKHRELAGGDVVWESNDGKYVVSDLTDENVFLTQDGHIAVIDANIQLNTPGSDGSGHYKIPSFRSSGQAEDTLNEVLAEVVEAAYGVGEDGSIDMAAHNRRYHPNGITENTHCKYLDRGDITGNSQNNEGNTQEHKSSIGEISYAEAERWFSDNGNVNVFHATKDDDLEFMGLTNFAKAKMKKGTPLSKNQFENSVKEFCIVCRDLKKRFSRFQFGFDAIYPYDTSSQSNGGMATADRRKGFGYIIIGDRAKIKDSLGIEDDKAYHFILRHEIGHSLSSDYISHRFDEVFSPSKLGEERISQISRVFKTVCHIGDFWFGEKDDEVRRAAKEEIIADVFAFYTDTGYKKGMMPKEIEEFCEEMIENPHLKSQSEMLAMDSVKHAEKIETPDYIEGFLEIKALHNPPKDTKKPYALNFIEDKWEYFDTEEERKEFVDTQRRLRQKTSQEDARDWMEQELPKIVAHISGKGKNSPGPSRDKIEKKLNEYAADAVEGAYGIGEDALDPSDPDFWMKHDRAKHRGHFDPETMTCKLREKAVAYEEKKDEEDKVDDLMSENYSGGVQNETKTKLNELVKILRRIGRNTNPEKDALLIASVPRQEQVIKAAKKFKNEKAASHVREVSASQFHKAISEAVSNRPVSDRWRVDIHPIDDYETYSCFVSDGGSVFALNGQDIVSVCKHRGDESISWKGLILEAINKGGRKLDSYEGNHAFYAKCGFEPISWTKFNPEYAPEGAQPEDIIFYKYTGNKRFLDKEGVEKEIEDFKRSINPMEYDDAAAYRDTKMG